MDAIVAVLPREPAACCTKVVRNRRMRDPNAANDLAAATPLRLSLPSSRIGRALRPAGVVLVEQLGESKSALQERGIGDAKASPFFDRQAIPAGRAG